MALCVIGWVGGLVGVGGFWGGLGKARGVRPFDRLRTGRGVRDEVSGSLTGIAFGEASYAMHMVH